MVHDMDISLSWEKAIRSPSSRIAKVKLGNTLQKVSTSGFSETSIENWKPHSRFHVESFCTPHHFTVVTYDSDPLTNLRIQVSSPSLLRGSAQAETKPTKLVYRTVCTKSGSATPRESPFSYTDEASLAQIYFANREHVTGVLFRVELGDGSCLSQYDGREFFVGLGERRIPYSVEVPLPWTLERRVESKKILGLYRPNLFWLQPQLDCSELCDLFHETNFVLAGLEGAQHDDGEGSSAFVCLMVTAGAATGTRTTLFGTGTYPAIRIESSSEELPLIPYLSDLVVCHMGIGDGPSTAVRRTIESHSRHIGSFSSRLRKVSSPDWRNISATSKVLNRIGYCTWDALGHGCSEQAVNTALKELENKQIPIGYVVIDDGWQHGGSSGPLSENDSEERPSPKLTSFQPNDKFPNSLRPLARDGKNALFAWLAIIGYWGGADGSCFKGATTRIRVRPSAGFRRNQPDNTKMWEREYEIMDPEQSNLDSFFTGYFEHLSTQGVTCVKVDGQSILGSFKADVKTDTSIAKNYRDAVTRAAAKAFPSEAVLNSMACAQEVILSSGEELTTSNACWRTSDDHAFPGVAESDDMVAWHVLRNATNSLFLGEIFPVPDWDMFRAGDRNGYMHAVARVVSGGPVYISDAVPFRGGVADSALAIVRGLTTGDGRILRCCDPGRPTADATFGDPRERGRMFKVFNRNSLSGVVGLFNLSTREAGRDVRGDYSPGDVEDFRRGPGASFISVVAGASWRCAFRHASAAAAQAISLAPMEAAVAHVYPILRFGALEIAVVGRLDLLNCGAVATSVCWCGGDAPGSASVEVALADGGATAIWLGAAARERLLRVTACGAPTELREVLIDEVSLLSVAVPEHAAESGHFVRLEFGNASGWD